MPEVDAGDPQPRNPHRRDRSRSLSSCSSSAGRRSCRSTPGVHAGGHDRRRRQPPDACSTATAAWSPPSTSARASMFGGRGADRAVRARAASAAERALTSDYLTLLAQRARLLAERTGQRDFAPPPEFATLSPEDREIADAGDVSCSARRCTLGPARSRPSNRCLGSARRQLVAAAVAAIRKQRAVADRTAEADRRRTRWSAQDRGEGLRVDQPRPCSSNAPRPSCKGQEAAMEAEYARAGEGIGETRMQSLSRQSRPARADRSRSQGHAEQAFGDAAQAGGDARAARTFTGSRAGDGAGRRSSACSPSAAWSRPARS